METLQYKNIKFQVWDLGGQTSIRPYWRCYYPNTDALIFVVDSADHDRLKIAKQELFAMLEVRARQTQTRARVPSATLPEPCPIRPQSQPCPALYWPLKSNAYLPLRCALPKR